MFILGFPDLAVGHLLMVSQDLSKRLAATNVTLGLTYFGSFLSIEAWRGLHVEIKMMILGQVSQTFAGLFH